MTDFAAPSTARALALAPKTRAYASVAVAYLVAYVALGSLAEHRSLNGSAITLWSPDDALSVMLLMESWTFAPVVWIGQFVTDYLFGHLHPSAPAAALADGVLALGYLGMSMALRHGFGLDFRSMRPRDLIAVMAVAPLGAAITGLFYCGALLAGGGLTPQTFLSAYAGFWIGDAAAIGVLIPAIGALLRVMAAKPWRRPDCGYALFLFSGTMIFLAMVVCLSASALPHRYLFNLTYLPILMIGMKYGYDAGALMVFFVQMVLLAALDHFQVIDRQYGAYQVMMFILAISGQAIGATVTEWEGAMQQLRRQQAELAKVSERATNGVIAAAMSHEISQPLASIAAYLYGSRRLLETGQQDKALAALRKAEAEAARARQIVERLRDLVANGAAPLERVDLDELAATILRLQRDAARERGVTLRRVDEPRGNAFASIDRVGVEQALANLVLNAIEAAPAQGGEVALAIETRGGAAVFCIDDNGSGVAAEIADRLFEPFETTKPRGMGLGLPLAKEIAARHGGALRWRPRTPCGTRFELELPLA